MLQDFQTQLVDGEHATLVGTVVTNRCKKFGFMTTLDLEVELDSNALAELTGATVTSGKHRWLLQKPFDTLPYPAPTFQACSQGKDMHSIHSDD